MVSRGTFWYISIMETTTNMRASARLNVTIQELKFLITALHDHEDFNSIGEVWHLKRKIRKMIEKTGSNDPSSPFTKHKQDNNM